MCPPEVVTFIRYTLSSPPYRVTDLSLCVILKHVLAHSHLEPLSCHHMQRNLNATLRRHHTAIRPLPRMGIECRLHMYKANV